MNHFNFNEEQLEAINYARGNCAVFATAGSGKTAVIVEHVHKLITKNRAPQNSILVLAFNAEAVNLLKQKIHTEYGYKDVKVITFHSLGYHILCRHSSGKIRVLSDQDKKFYISRILLEQNEPFDRENTNAVSTAISYYKSMNIPVDDIPDYTHRKIYREYEKVKQESMCYDFDDLLEKSVQYLKHYTSLKHRFSYKYIIVDEAQDINYHQMEILKALNKERRLFMVGDTLQGIYGWRGSDSKHILDFLRENKTSKIIQMNKNYRCAPEIVAYANNFAQMMDITKSGFYTSPEATKPAGGLVSVKQCTDVEEEANIICKIYKKKKNDECMAVLARTNSQLFVLNTLLFKKGIPVNYCDNKKISDYPVVRTVISLLRLVIDSSDNKAFADIAKTCPKLLDPACTVYLKRINSSNLFQAAVDFSKNDSRQKNDLLSFVSFINKLKQADYKKVSSYIKRISNDLKLEEYFNKRNDSHQEKDTASDILASMSAIAGSCKTIKEFLSLLENTKSNKNGIKLMTIHKSKGLEFDTVVISDVCNGILPHKNTENIEEEKRLFYVACTRAKNALHILSPKLICGEQTEISPFIEGSLK